MKKTHRRTASISEMSITVIFVMLNVCLGQNHLALPTEAPAMFYVRHKQPLPAWEYFHISALLSVSSSKVFHFML